jgi:hypothetical protein
MYHEHRDLFELYNKNARKSLGSSAWILKPPTLLDGAPRKTNN